MARDYQRRANPKARQKKQKSIWKWFLVVLLVGLFAAFLVQMSPEKAENKAQKLLGARPTQTVKESRDVKKVEAVAIPEKIKPRFEFYTKLPEIEVIVPEHEIAQRRSTEGSDSANRRQYVIQAGSFRRYKDADRRKAQLAMLGLEPRVEMIQNGSSKWNRVLVGPYTSMRKVDGIRSRLRKARIDAVVLTRKAP